MTFLGASFDSCTQDSTNPDVVANDPCTASYTYSSSSNDAIANVVADLRNDGLAVLTLELQHNQSNGLVGYTLQYADLDAHSFADYDCQGNRVQSLNLGAGTITYTSLDLNN